MDTTLRRSGKSGLINDYLTQGTTLSKQNSSFELQEVEPERSNISQEVATRHFAQLDTKARNIVGKYDTDKEGRKLVLEAVTEQGKPMTAITAACFTADFIYIYGLVTATLPITAIIGYPLLAIYGTII